ncbi:HsdM family class I SAM-dependent methyltransferase [Viridibacillus sp. NPDC096237]|uniref:HsdM family class I SAM-dependent methyltransferase n=1 Tax=Viridibacillus sp. NPDC096237 TaxID=3390721 RepID=UPI003CFF7F49
MGEKGSVDTKIIDKLKSQGYESSEFNYNYIIPSNGNAEIKPLRGKKFLSKSLKESRMELEFCIFSEGKKRAEKNKRLIIIEDKKDSGKMGSFETMHKEEGLYKYALTDLYHYAKELLSKTSDIKEIFGIAVAGEELGANALYFFKEGAVIDKYVKELVDIGDNIKMVKIPCFKEWDRIGKDKLSTYINGDILRLSSIDSIENVTHVKSVAAKLSKSIDVSLKLDPYKRLLLVCGLLIGINEDDTIIAQFNDRKGPSLLFETIKEALPESKFDTAKKKQLLRSFYFIKEEPELQTNVINKKGKVLDMPLKIITDELLTKSAVGYSVVDLMKESTHIDLLGYLFDIFTKYMAIGGSAGDIVLTPSHLTKFMSDIISIDENDYILDITVGTGGFLIAAMKRIENLIMSDTTLSLTEREKKIESIKAENLWGVEFDANMFATCVSNMMLHGDGKSHIFRGDSLIGKELTGEKRKLDVVFEGVEFTKLLFNPPYDNHLEYVRNGLSYMKKGGKAAIIIPKNTFNKSTERQDAIKEEIFLNNRLLAVIDLPKGQFKTKNKTVGTDVAIFVFESGFQQIFKEEIEVDNKVKEIGDIVTFIKLKKDEVHTKGAKRGLPSEKTEKIYEHLTDYIVNNFLDDTLLSNSEYFEKPLKKKVVKYKFMYKDYASLPDIKPKEEDFLETIGKYLDFIAKESKRSDNDDI